MTNTFRKEKKQNQFHKYNQQAEIAESFLQKNGTVLLVEGENDEKFVKRILAESNYNKQIKIKVHPLNDYFEEKCGNKTIAKEDKKFYIGGFGKVDAKKAIIITIKKHTLDEQKPNDNNSIKKTYYGIVDKDYDENDFVLQDIRTNVDDGKYKELSKIDVIKEQRLISTDTNDVETMLFKFDMETIKKICIEKGFSLENTYDYEYGFIKDSACKLGYLRRVNHDKELMIDFKSLFHYQRPADYEKYMTVEEFNISGVLSDLASKKKSDIKLSEMPEKFAGIEWLFCRGHDLTGILSCYYILKKYGNGNCNDIINEPGKKLTREQVIKNTESELIDEILKKTILEKYKDSKVFKFIEGIIRESNQI